MVAVTVATVVVLVATTAPQAGGGGATIGAPAGGSAGGTTSGSTRPGAGADDGASTAADPIEPDRGPANVRLGLHVTSLELAEWRRRAVEGPYRVEGDVSPNSPGDWVRIEEQAERFLRRPDAGRWEGPRRNNPKGCVRRGVGNPGWRKTSPPIAESTELLSAAFYAMVTGSDEHARLVRDELLAQARKPGVDFADRDRWCLGRVLDGMPGFMIATWLSKLLYALDYVEIHDPALLRAEERAELEAWFVAAAEWMAHDTDVKLDELFADRAAGEYDLTDVAVNGEPDPVFYDGPDVVTLQRRFNNRNARQARYVTLVGIWADRDDLVEHGKRYVRDALRFSYFPNGATGDFERWTEEDPTLGWKYGTEFAGALLTIADTLARAGDAELYEFETTDGALGTAGARPDGSPKSLEALVEDLLRYVDRSYRRYGTDASRRAGDERYLIDSVNDLNDEARINDIQLIVGNSWFDNDYIEAVVTRQADGSPPYPQEPATGAGDPEGGESGSLPGVMFMFAGTDVDPYDVERP